MDGKQSNSINISDQLEGAFLLSERSAIRANAIGRLVGVHLVDEAITDTLKDIRNFGLLKRNTNEQLNKQIEEIEKYDYLDELEETIKILEKNKNKIFDLEQNVNKLKQISINLKNTESDTTKIESIIIKLANLDDIISKTKELSIKIKIYLFIDNKFKTLLDIKNNICYNENIINKTKKLVIINNYIKNLQVLVAKRDQLLKLRIKKINIEENLKYNKNILVNLKSLHKFDENIINIDCNYSKLELLKSLNNKILIIDKKISFGINYLNKLSNIDKIGSKITSIENKYNPLCSMIKIKNKREILLTELKKTKILINNYDEEIKHLIVTYKNILSKFEVCPLCLNKIDKNTLDKIVENYK